MNLTRVIVGDYWYHVKRDEEFLFTKKFTRNHPRRNHSVFTSIEQPSSFIVAISGTGKTAIPHFPLAPNPPRLRVRVGNVTMDPVYPTVLVVQPPATRAVHVHTGVCSPDTGPV